MACSTYRGIDERIEWMLDHPPGEPGMCARETWQALGGDQSPPCPPAWGCPDANAVYDKIVASGRYWTTTPIPRGAVIAWKYGEHGHAALSAGDGDICTTDPQGWSGGTGIEPLSYPEKWGASASKRIWTDTYNGVTFDIEQEDQMIYDYLEKPGGSQTVGRSYVDLDQSKWDSPIKGWESTLVYLNITPTFQPGKTHGSVRVRLQRQSGDAHAPHTIPIDIDDLDEDGVFTTQYHTYELGEKGKWTKVQLKCEGGLESVKVSTRYTTKVVVA